MAVTGEARKAQADVVPLDESGPGVGLAILFDGQEWRVTGQSSYWNDEGYRVHEWCCEAGDTTGYLLKEADPKQGSIRWFFTREIPEDAVGVEGGGPVAEWMGRGPEPKPPPALCFHQNAYRYEETTEGTHEDDAGETCRGSRAAILALRALALPFGARCLTDWLLLSGVTIRQEVVGREVPNVGVGYLEALFYVGTSFLIAWTL